MNQLLSDSFSTLLYEMQEKYPDNEILRQILTANAIVEGIRTYLPDSNRNILITHLYTDLITDDVSMLTFRRNESTISFLPKGRTPEYTEFGIWSRENRQTGKVARIFQKLLRTKFETKDWEDFSNMFKAAVCNCYNFELVEGDKIPYWYSRESYYREDGTLGNSCMRYDNISHYFDIYVDNAKMLITTKDGKLTGRAIVWTIGDVTIMDRVYTCFDYLTECFYDYAKENKWWIRAHNSLLSSGEKQYWLTPKDNYHDEDGTTFRIHLNKHYDHFPYLDSFRYYNYTDNSIFTDPDDDCYDYTLDRTDGDLDEVTTYICACCGRTLTGIDGEIPDDMVYSEYLGEYYCIDCAYYSDTIEDWVPNNALMVNVDVDGYIEKYPEEYVENRLLTRSNRAPSWIKYIYFIEIDGKYYLYDSERFVYNEDTKEYEIRSDSE